ncbi:hypothetical protein KH400_06135 [Desertibacillus haloalkaliphilus]|nr:hypothetical protein [Desertibacillus haloalkaliphilus]
MMDGEDASEEGYRARNIAHTNYLNGKEEIVKRYYIEKDLDYYGSESI